MAVSQVTKTITLSGTYQDIVDASGVDGLHQLEVDCSLLADGDSIDVRVFDSFVGVDKQIGDTISISGPGRKVVPIITRCSITALRAEAKTITGTNLSVKTVDTIVS